MSIDAERTADGRLEVLVDGGTAPHRAATPPSGPPRPSGSGAGEILLNSIDRDGTGSGYDLDLVRAVAARRDDPGRSPAAAWAATSTSPPAILEGGASAVAAANIFHFFELSYPLREAGVPRRRRRDAPGVAGEPLLPARARHTTRPSATGASRPGPPRPRGRCPADTPPPAEPMRWCTRCVYPAISAVPLEFDEHGVCTGLPRGRRAGRDPRRRVGPPPRAARASCSSAHRSRDGSRLRLRDPGQRRQGQLLPDPRHRGRARPATRCSSPTTATTGPRRAGATCTA